MFINATQLTQNRAPLDASSVAFQVAIKQQKEFEEALKSSQDRREAEAAAERAQAAAERAQAEAQKESARAKVVSSSDPSAANLDSVPRGNSSEVTHNDDTRGASVDVEV